MEGYQVATEETLEDLKPVFVNPEVRRTWKWLMKVKTDIGLLKLLLEMERHHDELAVVYPDSLAADLMPYIYDFLRYSLIYVVEGTPVLKILVSHVVKIFKIVEERSKDIFEKHGIGSGLLCRHENRVRIKLFKLFCQLLLLKFTDIFQGCDQADPIKFVLSLLHHVLEGTV